MVYNDNNYYCLTDFVSSLSRSGTEKKNFKMLEGNVTKQTIVRKTKNWVFHLVETYLRFIGLNVIKSTIPEMLQMINQPRQIWSSEQLTNPTVFHDNPRIHEKYEQNRNKLSVIHLSWLSIKA